MGFAQGFATGSRVVNDAKDRYEQEQQLKQFRSIADAKVEESSSYQPQDIEQIQAMADARKPDGTPYYDMGMQGGSYTAKPNFEYEGGSQQAIALDPKKRYSYLGRAYDQQPTEVEQQRAQAQAFSKAVSRTNPLQGMQLQQGQQKFEWEQADALHKQNERARADKLRTGWQEKFSELTGILNTQGPKAMVEAVGGWFSQDGSGFPTMLTYDDKEGRIFMTSHVGGRGRVKELSVPQALALAQGMYEMGNGDPQTGLKTILTMEEQRQRQMASEVQANNQAVGMVAQNDGRLRDDRRADTQLNYSMMDGNRRYGLQAQGQANTQNYQQGMLAQGERRIALDEYRTAHNVAKDDLAIERAGNEDRRRQEDHDAQHNPPIEKQWRDIERSMSNADPGMVTARRNQFYASQGYAPPDMQKAASTGKWPDGKPLTREDYDELQTLFPKSKLKIPSKISRTFGAEGGF